MRLDENLSLPFLYTQNNVNGKKDTYFIDLQREIVYMLTVIPSKVLNTDK